MEKQEKVQQLQMTDLVMQVEKFKTIAGLCAGVTHEINTSIGCIAQSAQNISRRISPELEANRQAAQELEIDLETIYAYLEKRQILGFLEDIRVSADKAARTVSNMLGFSPKPKSGRTSGTAGSPRDTKAVDPAGLIESSLELAGCDYELRKKYGFKSIKIIRQFKPGRNKILCRPDEIEQVLFNLLKNAAQALHKNKDIHLQPVITISVTQEESSVKISVEDNGPGMDDRVQKEIFAPFFTTRSMDSGTGLGLYVAHYIVVHNHKGTLSVKTAPGKGTTFIIRLPDDTHRKDTG